MPKGKGFAPLSWQILDGQNDIPICLLEASEKVVSGLIYYREVMHFNGTELNKELRHIQGKKTVELCLRFMNETHLPEGIEQEGHETFYERRQPIDSRLDVDKSFREQFNLMRIVDNESYPAFFDLNGERYVVHIHRMAKKD